MEQRNERRTRILGRLTGQRQAELLVADGDVFALNQTTLGQVGQCIYCGRSTGLSKEHLIPLGLSGSYFLADASCAEHRDVTSRWERLVLRDLLGIPRLALGVASRRKSRRRMRLDRTEGDVTERLGTLTTEQAPGILLLPILREPPNPLRPVPEQDPKLLMDGIFSYELFPDRLEELAGRLGPMTVQWKVSVPMDVFTRFLAKVAWGFAVARFGIARLAPYVLPRMLTEESLAAFVGGISERPPAEPCLHLVRVQAIDGEVLVHMRFFALFGAPIYVSRVARLRPPVSVPSVTYRLPPGW